MTNLFEELADYLRPDHSAFYFSEDKEKAKGIFERFKNMKPDEPGFLTALDDVDRQVTNLKLSYDCDPDWLDEYNAICDRYFYPMQIKVIKKFNLN